MNPLDSFTVERLDELINFTHQNGLPHASRTEWQALAKIALATKNAQPIGQVSLSEYDSDGCRSGTVRCLHNQADWDNFAEGTKLYLAPPQRSDCWIKCSERMPDENRIFNGDDFSEEVLVIDQYEDMFVTCTHWGKWSCLRHPDSIIQYWMPLPALPNLESAS